MGLVNRFLNKFGYKLIYKGTSTSGERFVMVNSAEKFDEDRYVKVQTEGNKRKLDRVWVREENIKFLSDYVLAELGRVPNFGLCHGTRRGVEQIEFRKNLNCNVIGTEISDTASRFPHTIQWDFHKVKDEWVNATDFVYSNSLDHSHSPRACLDGWVSCLTDDGMLFLEKASDSDAEMVSELDPFGADLDQFVFHLVMWGAAGGYYICNVIEPPSVNPDFKYQYVFVIRRR
jgi:hypothetical protein